MPLLTVENLNAFYGDVQILYDVSLDVNAGEVVSIVGANAAGKSTLLRTLSGLLKKISGSILFKGEELIGKPAYDIAGKKLIHIPEGRRVFPMLSVQENLEIGGYTQKSKENTAKILGQVFEIFPPLATHKKQMAGSLSGGEQQMLAIARGLMASPVLLMIDEPSLGLAPILVEKTFQVLKKIKGDNVTILLVEQNVVKALKFSDRAYVLENGRITLKGKGGDLLKDAHLKKAYMGI